MLSIGLKEVEALWMDLGNSPDHFGQNLINFQRRIENLGRALDQLDFERLHIECHTVSGLSREVGASQLFEILSELEFAAIARDTYRIREVRTRCEEEMMRVLGDLTDFLRHKQAA